MPILTHLALASILLSPLVPASAHASQHIMSAHSRSSGVTVSDVRDELVKAEIIPTVIDDFTPSMLLQASWSAHDQTQLGNTLNPGALKDTPTLTIGNPPDGPTKKASLVVALTDPDAPSRDNPKWSEFCHWIATAPAPDRDATGETLRLQALDDVMEYKPPTPPEKTGKHRYVFLAFVAANGTEEVLHPSKPGARKHWGYDGDGVRGVRQWASDNGLVPVAANFIYAQNDKQ
ncbi:phosphatidylethanolamine-binding protein [Podospora conica]|nr:phosphatidylethanolamine-binding protein [Schizothecium conicum]